ncbi:MAG: hypothetical protein ABI591_14680 [Kofleriaceae bacterium]
MRAAVWVVLVACSSHPPVTTIAAAGDLVATTSSDIDGFAAFPPQHIDDPALEGKVADLTSEVDGERNRWTLAVEDNANLRHTYSIELPARVVFAITTGTHVLVEPEVVGGGPNATGHIAVSDEHGAVVLAIGKLPAGWSAEPGTAIATTPGTSYDEQTFAVRVKEPGGAAVELVPTPWRSFELAGAKFVGNGNAAKRELHGEPPPDYVAAWTDFTIVRSR